MLCRYVLCIVGYLASSLTSAHWILAASPRCDSPNCQISPGGQNHPWLKIIGLKERAYLPFLLLNFIFARMLTCLCVSVKKEHSQTLGFFFFWAALEACGGSQPRGLIRAVATGLCQRQSNMRSELRLQPTPQLTATPDR